jgi:hypothetical protein
VKGVFVACACMCTYKKGNDALKDDVGSGLVAVVVVGREEEGVGGGGGSG